MSPPLIITWHCTVFVPAFLGGCMADVIHLHIWRRLVWQLPIESPTVYNLLYYPTSVRVPYTLAHIWKPPTVQILSQWFTTILEFVMPFKCLGWGQCLFIIHCLKHLQLCCCSHIINLITTDTHKSNGGQKGNSSLDRKIITACAKNGGLENS